MHRSRQNTGLRPTKSKVDEATKRFRAIQTSPDDEAAPATPMIFGFIENIGITHRQHGKQVLENLIELGMDFGIISEHCFQNIGEEVMRDEFPSLELFQTYKCSLVLNQNKFKLLEIKTDIENDIIWAKIVLIEFNIEILLIGLYCLPKNKTDSSKKIMLLEEILKKIINNSIYFLEVISIGSSTSIEMAKPILIRLCH